MKRYEGQGRGARGQDVYVKPSWGAMDRILYCCCCFKVVENYWLIMLCLFAVVQVFVVDVGGGGGGWEVAGVWVVSPHS